MTEQKDFIDHQLIARADAKLAAAAARWDEAYASLTNAKSICDRAKVAADCSPSLENEETLEKAELALRVAEKICIAPAGAHGKAKDWHKHVRAAAHGPQYMTGIRMRIAAAAKLDAARALLLQAEQDYLAGIAVCNAAFTAGHPHLGQGARDRQLLSRHETIGTWIVEGGRDSAESREIDAWRGNNVDPLSANGPWAESILAGEPK